MYVAEPTLGRSFWQRLRKMRPSKWKPADFVKAGAVVGAGVFLGPLAAGLAVKGAGAAAALASRGAGAGLTAARGQVPSFTSVATKALGYKPGQTDTTVPVDPGLPPGFRDVGAGQYVKGPGVSGGALIAGAALLAYVVSRRR